MFRALSEKHALLAGHIQEKAEQITHAHPGNKHIIGDMIPPRGQCEAGEEGKWIW